MAKAHAEWTVLSHEPLEQLTNNLWRVEGSLQGMELRRVMAIAKLASGGLVVHNAICLDDDEMEAIDALGPVEVLIVPSGFHRLDAAVWKARYPKARVLCPRGATAKVEEVVEVDGDYDDLGPDAAVTLAHVDGTRGREGVMTVRSSDDASLVFNDLLFNMPHLSGVTGFVVRHVLQSSGGPRISRMGRLAIVAQEWRVHDALLSLADTEGLARVLVAHHETIDDDPAAALRDVAATLR